jgi:hypothetical protein
MFSKKKQEGLAEPSPSPPSLSTIAPTYGKKTDIAVQLHGCRTSATTTATKIGAVS